MQEGTNNGGDSLSFKVEQQKLPLQRKMEEPFHSPSESLLHSIGVIGASRPVGAGPARKCFHTGGLSFFPPLFKILWRDSHQTKKKLRHNSPDLLRRHVITKSRYTTPKSKGRRRGEKLNRISSKLSTKRCASPTILGCSIFKDSSSILFMLDADYHHIFAPSPLDPHYSSILVLVPTSCTISHAI